MLEMSAMAAKMKITTLPKEVLRIRKDMHPKLPWECTVAHLDDFAQHMRSSGYNEDYRLQVI